MYVHTHTHTHTHKHTHIYIYILEQEMATHSRILAWRMPWTEEPDGLQSTGSQRARHNRATEHKHIMSMYN